MKNYESKQKFIESINSSINKYLLELSDISEEEKNKKAINNNLDLFNIIAII